MELTPIQIQGIPVRVARPDFFSFTLASASVVADA